MYHKVTAILTYLSITTCNQNSVQLYHQISIVYKAETGMNPYKLLQCVTSLYNNDALFEKKC